VNLIDHEERTRQTKAAQMRVLDRYGAEQCLIYRAYGDGRRQKALWHLCRPASAALFVIDVGKIGPLYAKVRQRGHTSAVNAGITR
jgi:hypothetical protein